MEIHKINFFVWWKLRLAMFRSFNDFFLIANSLSFWKFHILFNLKRKVLTWTDRYNHETSHFYSWNIANLIILLQKSKTIFQVYPFANYDFQLKLKKLNHIWSTVSKFVYFFFVKLILKLFSQNYVIFKFKETKIILLIVNFVNWIPFF